MKPNGGVTYIGVSLKELNKYFKEDAVIHVSKKFLKSYQMITGITEQPKPISMNIVEKTEKIDGPIEKIDTSIKEKEETLPPIELNISNGDW
tara:strand:+ start:1120 stop:1395 length:276 start_codon:yes stop_codon:yes gene_type:complete